MRFRRIHIWISKIKVLNFYYGMNRIYPNCWKVKKRERERERERGAAAPAVAVVRVAEASA